MRQFFVKGISTVSTLLLFIQDSSWCLTIRSQHNRHTPETCEYQSAPGITAGAARIRPLPIQWKQRYICKGIPMESPGVCHGDWTVEGDLHYVVQHHRITKPSSMRSSWSFNLFVLRLNAFNR